MWSKDWCSVFSSYSYVVVSKVCWKYFPFPGWNVLLPLSQTSWPYMCESISGFSILLQVEVSNEMFKYGIRATFFWRILVVCFFPTLGEKHLFLESLPTTIKFVRQFLIGIHVLWARIRAKFYNYRQRKIQKLRFKLGQIQNGTKYFGDLTDCNPKLIHVLFLWENLQVKELNMSGRQLKDLGTSSAKTIRDLDLSKLPSFFLFLFMPRKVIFQGSGSLALFPWHWCGCVGLPLSGVQEKQMLYRTGFNHHLRSGSSHLTEVQEILFVPMKVLFLTSLHLFRCNGLSKQRNQLHWLQKQSIK